VRTVDDAHPAIVDNDGIERVRVTACAKSGGDVIIAKALDLIVKLSKPPEIESERRYHLQPWLDLQAETAMRRACMHVISDWARRSE
jgi:hypothetical protein